MGNAVVKVYRDYDQTSLDAQYTGRSRIPNYDSYVPRWQKESAAARKQLSMVADVRYGDHPQESFDVFPAGASSPVHIFFHGGFWYSQDKLVFEFMARRFVGAGATFVSVNYPLCPDVSLTRLIESCRAAAAYIWRHAGDWRADPGRLHIAGHSAGGHIVAMLLSTGWRAWSADLPNDMIKGGLALSGLYDLEPIRLCYVNESLQLDAGEAAAMSPHLQIPDRSGELLFAVGGDESEEFRRQQEGYVAAWCAKGLAGRTIDMPRYNHFSIMDDYAAPDGRLAAACLRQMGL